MTRRSPTLNVVAVLSIALASGCSSGAQSSFPALPLAQRGGFAGFAGTGAGKIQHVVYVIQEGRSFNTLFAGMPNADTSLYGYLSNGKRIKLRPISLKSKYNLDDSAYAMFVDCNGTGKLPGTDCRMNGFNKEASFGGPKHPQYVYVSRVDTKPYFAMAHEWVVADHMFASQLDGSFIAHQYAIAAQAERAVGIPVGAPCGPNSTIATLSDRRLVGRQEEACFSDHTIAEELDTAKLSWLYYTTGYTDSPFTWNSRFDKSRGERKHIVSPPQQFLSDVKSGKLANFTWVTPTCADSDKVSCGGGSGPAWVAAVVNAVGRSKFWDSTAIFVQWSDWGGFYDNVAPEYKNFDSLGFRVPLLVISPYAKSDYVSHVHYESAGVLRFAEDVFGLDQLAAADKRAVSPAGDCFDFNQPPRKFVPIMEP